MKPSFEPDCLRFVGELPDMLHCENRLKESKDQTNKFKLNCDVRASVSVHAVAGQLRVPCALELHHRGQLYPEPDSCKLRFIVLKTVDLLPNLNTGTDTVPLYRCFKIIL